MQEQKPDRKHGVLDAARKPDPRHVFQQPEIKFELFRIKRNLEPVIFAVYVIYPEQESRGLRYDRGERDPCDSPPEHYYKQKIKGYVHDIGYHQKQQRNLAVPQTLKNPAVLRLRLFFCLMS